MKNNNLNKILEMFDLAYNEEFQLYTCGENTHACVWDESRFSFS